MNVFKSLMRLGGNAHFVSDIFLGIALAAFINLGFIYWFHYWFQRHKTVALMK